MVREADSGNNSPIKLPFAELHLKDMKESELLESILSFGEDWTQEQKKAVNKAYSIAAEIFKDDLYKGDPYVYHLLRVANRVVGYMELPDWELAIGALLHDVKEDHPKEFILALNRSLSEEDLAEVENIEDLASFTMEQEFTSRVSHMIDAVSNPPSLSKKNYETIDEFIFAYEHKVEEAVETTDGWVIKFADWCDNGLGIIYSDLGEDEIEVFREKYGRALPHLERKYKEPDIQEMLSPNAHSYVQQQFAHGRERLGIA